MNSPQRLLRPAEAAAQLGVSKATVYRLIASGDIGETVHVGTRRATRIEQSALDAYIERNRIQRSA